jgi:hypothetical protein
MCIQQKKNQSMNIMDKTFIQACIRPSNADPPARLTERHFPAYIPPTASLPSLARKKIN